MELSSFKTEDYFQTKKAFSKMSNLMINNGYLINNKLNSPKRQWISQINKSLKTNRTTIISRKMNKTMIHPFIKSTPPEIKEKTMIMKIKESKARQKYIDAQPLKKLRNLRIRYQALKWCSLFHSNPVDMVRKDKGWITLHKKLSEIALLSIHEEEKNYDISSPNIFQSIISQILLRILKEFIPSVMILHIYQQVIIVYYHILSFFWNSADLEVILKISKSFGLFKPTDWKEGSLYQNICTPSLRKNFD